MRIVLVSTSRILHFQWSKAIDSKILNLYDKKEIEDFTFLKDDIVIFDYDNLKDFLSVVLKAKVIALSSQLDSIIGFRLLKKGVKAYGDNYLAPINLKEIIKIVKENQVWVYPELMSFIITNSTLNNLPNYDSKIDELSKREFDVSKLVSKGFTNKQIAKQLDITERTVKAHVSSIFSKFDIKDRVTLGIMIKEYLNSFS